MEGNAVIRSFKLRLNVTDELHGLAFFVRQQDAQTGSLVRYATPLFLALIIIEIADIVFSVDSVAVVFTNKTDP